MTSQVNWQKIRTEINRLADVDKLKSEVQRIGTEIRNFDFQSMLSPAAQAKMKKFEKRYSGLMRSISQAQRQMDREFNRILRQIKVRRADVDKVVSEQKDKLEKASMDLRKKFSSKASARPTASPRKRTSRKTATAKTTKARTRKKV